MVIGDLLIYICCALIVIIPVIISIIVHIYIAGVVNTTVVPYIGTGEEDNTFFYSSMWMDE